MTAKVKLKKSRFLIMPDKILPEGKLADRLAYPLSFGLLFIISVVYFYWFGNNVFIHQENSVLFIYSAEYLQKFTAQPGGLLVYAGYFLTQGYFNALYGSLVISTLLFLINLVFLKIYRHMSVDSNFSLLLILIPSCSLLLLHTRYDIYIHNSLGYLLTGLWLLVSIRLLKSYSRYLILILYPMFYYVVGSFALIYLGMYVVFCSVHSKGTVRYYLPAFLIGTAVLSFFIFKEVLFLQPAKKLLGYPLTFLDTSRLGTLLSLLSGFMVIFPLITFTTSQFKVKKALSGVVPWITILSVFPAMFYLLTRNYDPAVTKLMKIERSVNKQDWNEVIRQYERSQLKNAYAQYYYNVALSEKGQLCNRMFQGQQDFGPLALTLPSDIEQADKAMYYYYAVGLSNEARHLAYEWMVTHGYCPGNIKMLIKTELINGNYQIAERYIHVLKKTLHYKKWARKYEKLAHNPALIASDPELGEKIRMIPAKDFFIGTNDSQNIGLLLLGSPNNRRAFEYKIARMLLEKDFMAVVNEVKKMKEIGYTSIPRHIEEAILAYIYFTKEVPDLGGLYVTPETEQRFIRYIDVYRANNGDKSRIEKKMGKSDKNTFWYYLQFKTISSEFWESAPADNTVYGS